MTTTPTNRAALHAYASPECHDAWHDPEWQTMMARSLGEHLADVIRTCRKLDAQRRRRARNGGTR